MSLLHFELYVQSLILSSFLCSSSWGETFSELEHCPNHK